MGSGGKTMIINSRERALSSDTNRGWRFGSAMLMEHLRWRFLANATSGATPLAAEVLGGLLVRPMAGSMGLSVDRGALAAMVGPFDSGDVAQDDSPLIYASNDSVYTDPAFVVVGNASGSIRWDFIECRPKLVVSETDNRDIFDPETQLFTAALVNKVTKSSLEFRVRAGTDGAGLPTLVNGWLPIAAICVPNAAGSTDACAFYDLRPMLEDLEGPRDSGRSRMRGTAMLVILGGVTGHRALGSFSGTFQGRRIGGPITRCSPGTTTPFDFGNLTTTYSVGTEQTSDFNAPALANFYAVFPRGLPRWQKYADLPSARVPTGPKGLLVVSPRVPTAEGWESVAGFTMPTAYGLGAVDSTIVCAFTAKPSSGTGVILGRWRDDVFQQSVPGSGKVEPAGSGSTANFTPGVDWPANAKALTTALRRTWSGVTVGSVWSEDFTVTGSQSGFTGDLNNGSDYQPNVSQEIVYAATASTGVIRSSNRVPVMFPGVDVSLDVSDSVPRGGGAPGTVTAYVTGWEV